MTKASVLELDSENFSEAISQGLVLLDFFSQSCGPCKMMAPLIEELAEENPQVKVFKVDVEKAAECVQQFGVTHVPTLVSLQDGQEAKRSIGLKDKDEILSLIPIS